MKDLNRNGRPFPPLAYRRALITIESFGKLRTAKRRMHRIAAHVPDSYISVQQNEQASLS
jgi:hypothetical protein